MRTIPTLFFLLLIGGLSNIVAQTFDISSGGTPTITGSSGGSVTGSSSVTTNLVVTINFGEVSPINTNNIVKVVVPVGIRSLNPYKVTASVTSSVNVNPQSIQLSDIGFGANNMRAVGFLAQNCTNSPHIFYSPFNNDPASNVTLNGSGRAAYPGSLNNMGASPTILSGPQLSTLTAGRFNFNLYVFDAIFTMTPQFYAPGTASATVTFTISAGPIVPC
jgi:hypothetical protein